MKNIFSRSLLAFSLLLAVVVTLCAAPAQAGTWKVERKVEGRGLQVGWNYLPTKPYRGQAVPKSWKGQMPPEFMGYWLLRQETQGTTNSTFQGVGLGNKPDQPSYSVVFQTARLRAQLTSSTILKWVPDEGKTLVQDPAPKTLCVIETFTSSCFAYANYSTGPGPITFQGTVKVDEKPKSGGHTLNPLSMWMAWNASVNVSKEVISVKKVEGGEVRLPSHGWVADISATGDKEHEGTLQVNFWHSVEIGNLSLSAMPTGKYSIIKDTPTDKEYLAYARWKARIPNTGDQNGHDPFTNIEPFIGGQSAFVTVAQRRDGSPIFPDVAAQLGPENVTHLKQKYIWTAEPDYYVPAIPQRPDQNVNVVTVRKFLKDTSDAWTSALYPYAPDIVVEAYDLTGLVPEWWEDYLWQFNLAAQAFNPPQDWRLDTSTPNKTLHWDFGVDPTNDPPPSVVKVKITDGAGAQPPLPVGKVKINWRRPPQTTYDITILPVEWQIPNDPDGTLLTALRNREVAIMNSPLLNDRIYLWSGITAGTVVATPAIGAGGVVIGKRLKIVLSKPLSAPFVARQIGRIVEKVDNLTPDPDGLLQGLKGKRRIDAREVGRTTSTVTRARDSWHTGRAATPEEKAHTTRRLSSADEEPATDGGGGDDAGGGGNDGGGGDDGNPPANDEPDPNDPDNEGDWGKVDEEEANTDKIGDENVVPPHWQGLRERGINRTDVARNKLVNPSDPNTPVNPDRRNDLTLAYGEIFEVNILNPDMEQGIVNGVSASSNGRQIWQKFNGDEQLLTVPNMTSSMTRTERTQLLGEMGQYVRAVKTTTDLRPADAEIPQILKFMQWLSDNPNKRAVLRILVSHPDKEGPCSSCENVIRWFNQQSEFKDRGQITTLAEDGTMFNGWDKAPDVYLPTP